MGKILTCEEWEFPKRGTNKAHGLKISLAASIEGAETIPLTCRECIMFAFLPNQVIGGSKHRLVSFT